MAVRITNGFRGVSCSIFGQLIYHIPGVPPHDTRFDWLANHFA